MMFTTMLLLGLTLAGSPLKKEPLIPKYHDTYGKETTQKLIQGCIEVSGEEYTAESILQFCFCHISILEDVITWDDQKKLTSEDRTELIGAIVRMCIDLGFGPELKKKKVYEEPEKLDI